MFHSAENHHPLIVAKADLTNTKIEFKLIKVRLDIVHVVYRRECPRELT